MWSVNGEKLSGGRRPHGSSGSFTPLLGGVDSGSQVKTDGLMIKSHMIMITRHMPSVLIITRRHKSPAALSERATDAASAQAVDREAARGAGVLVHQELLLAAAEAWPATGQWSQQAWASTCDGLPAGCTASSSAGSGTTAPARGSRWRQADELLVGQWPAEDDGVAVEIWLGKKLEG